VAVAQNRKKPIASKDEIKNREFLSFMRISGSNLQG